MNYTTEQIQLINKFKKEYNDNGYEIQDECLYEWKIDNWNGVSSDDIATGPEFNCYGNKWKILLYPKGCEDNHHEYISLYLSRIYDEIDYSIHIPVRIVLFVRDYYDYSKFYCKTLPIQYYTSIDDDDYGMEWGFGKMDFINISDFNKKYLSENNKCVIGVYFTVYQYTKEQFRNEMYISLYDDDEKKNIRSKGYFDWDIKNWKGLSKFEKGPTYQVGGYNWQLELHRKGYNKESKGWVSIFLKCLNIGNETLFIKYSFFIRNYDDPSVSVYRSSTDYVTYNTECHNWGKTKIIEKTKLSTKNKMLNKELITNNRCVVGVYFQIYEDKKEVYVINNLFNKMTLVEKNNENSLINIGGNGLRENMKKELREEIKQELREEIKEELRKEIEKELREKIEKEIKEKIEKENANKIQNMNYNPYQQPYQVYYPPTYYYQVNTPNSNSVPPQVNNTSPYLPLNVIPNQNVVLGNNPYYPPPVNVNVGPNPNGVTPVTPINNNTYSSPPSYVNSNPSPNPSPNPNPNPNAPLDNSYSLHSYNENPDQKASTIDKKN
ncbi:hypothetical protein BCR32DRAFT_268069 [Anaeromyces robustus]|uniref:MATH domain-containing protein n=1 Tax=Anaeromyces robustus TaxID=1754192 RepID=A0A1Y1X8U8_9FUNG|nr:hypothetical protein BCR32DRAFT_268069 [Anaeromyces robustus]|eukprot:ORX81774.1 hypothetical protein BCR32DRAFT_268069 [Anaeromyces robustus]